MNDIQTSIAIASQHIMHQHTNVCETVLGDVLRTLGLWDGERGTKARTAIDLRGRVELREHHGGHHITEVVIDGVRRCTIITSVEFTVDGGIAAVTSVKGER